LRAGYKSGGAATRGLHNSRFFASIWTDKQKYPKAIVREANAPRFGLLRQKHKKWKKTSEKIKNGPNKPRKREGRPGYCTQKQQNS